MSEYFLKPKAIAGKVKVELDLSNYAKKKKKKLKSATGIDTSSFGKQVHLTNLKSNVNKLDID